MESLNSQEVVSNAAEPPPLPQDSATPIAAPAAQSGGYGPVGGVTRGYETGDRARQIDAADRASRTSAVRGQTLSAVVLPLLLAPPIILCALHGFTGKASRIPYSPLWPWGATVIACVLIAGLLMAPVTRSGASRLLSLVAVAAFLLAPAGVLLYLEAFAHRPVTLAMGAASIVLYSVAGVMLFMTALTQSARESR